MNDSITDADPPLTARPRWGLRLLAAATAPLAGLSLLLLASARTASGSLAALVGLLLASLPWWMLARSPRGLRLAALSALVLGVALVARSPDGTFPAHTRSRTVYLAGRPPWRMAPTNLVPEVDQLALGTHLIWLVDPLGDRRGAARLRAAIRDVYLPAQRDRELRALGSALGDAILDADRGRIDVHVPAHAAGERLPGVVFLHGSAGSWQGYFRLWSELADRERFIVVQPSFGFGNWQRPGGLAAIERARRYLVEHTPCDPQRVVLACLSNGGRGVTRTLVAGPAGYRGVVFLSAVIEPRVLDDAALAAAWRGRPMLVIHGARDDRLPLDYLEEGVGMLREAGADVTLRVVAGEDHFLIFTRPALVFDEVGRWLRGLR